MNTIEDFRAKWGQGIIESSLFNHIRLRIALMKGWIDFPIAASEADAVRNADEWLQMFVGIGIKQERDRAEKYIESLSNAYKLDEKLRAKWMSDETKAMIREDFQQAIRVMRKFLDDGIKQDITEEAA